MNKLGSMGEYDSIGHKSPSEGHLGDSKISRKRRFLGGGSQGTQETRSTKYLARKRGGSQGTQETRSTKYLARKRGEVLVTQPYIPIKEYGIRPVFQSPNEQYEYIEELIAAIDQPSVVIEELDNGNVSVGIEEGDTVRVFAKNYTKQEAEILKEKIKQGEDELKKRSQQKWLEDEVALTKFSNDIGGVFGKVFTESTISIVEGILAATFVSIFGIPGAIALSLTLSVAGAKSDQNSVGPGILADVLASSFGANPALALTLGAGVVISRLCRVEYKEDVLNG